MLKKKYYDGTQVHRIISEEVKDYDTIMKILKRFADEPSALGTNLAEVGTDCISRQAAIDALDVLCQEHRYKIPGKGETYSQYNEAWQDALDRAEGAIFNLPSAQPMRKKGWWQEITASDCSDDPTLAGYDDPVVGCICSVCRKGYEKELMGEVYWNYCPNCGADMRGDPNE